LDDNVLTVIGQSRLFAEVELAAIAEELAETRRQRLVPGEALLNPALLNHEVHLLISGELLVCMEPGAAGAVARLKPGDCAGELSMLDENPPSAYVVAGSECEVLSISQECLWSMMKKQQGIALNLLYVLAERFRHNTEILLDSLEMQRVYRNMAESDALTGLRNRSWAREIFPKQLELSERIGQSVSLAIIDIDHFKQINDVYGHAVGDRVLQHIGRIFIQNLRGTDLSARYGGEEFVVMMPGTPLAKARITMERLRQRAEALLIELPDGGSVNCTLSIGISEWRPGLMLDELIRFADSNLYRAKSLGRNQVCDS
jgi:diguanylate cyclase (GGDEF)-like protein